MAAVVRGVGYRLSIPRYLAAKALGRRLPTLYYGRLSNVGVITLPRRPLPGPDWVRLVPILAGICGSDLGTITGRNSPALSPLVSFPAVLGHEVVARVVEAGPQAGVAAGQRVVVNPFLPCQVRGLEPCPTCQRGETCMCENFDQGAFAPGMLLGFCRDLPGAWSEEFLAHRSQLFPAPAGLSDDRLVLVEPLAIALHAVLREPPGEGARVLVVGAGPIGLATIAALRLLELPVHVTVVAKYPLQEELARRFGADRVYRWRRGEAPAFRAAREVTGARILKPVLGRAVVSGGFDVTYDCVGSRASLDDALRVTRPGGRVVVAGAAGQIPQLDWTFVWSKGLRVVGSVGYELEQVGGRQVHTIQLAMELLEGRPDLPLEAMITHRFPMERYREALALSLGPQRREAVKVVFTGPAREDGAFGRP